MHAPIVEQIAALGSELNTNQYKLVRLAAQYDIELEWFSDGFTSPAVAIARTLDIHSSTAREWIRVGHALASLPRIDQEFRVNRLSYAKTRILTRWANADNEQELLDLASDRSANRLTTAVANYLAGDETASERDLRHHDSRSVTVHTDADGMIIIRAALPPNIGKQIASAVAAIVQQVAATPFDDGVDRGGVKSVGRIDSVGESGESGEETGAGALASAVADVPLPVAGSVTAGDGGASADAAAAPTMAAQLRGMKRRWQAADSDDFCIPSLAQQWADAFVLLFLGTNVNIATEVVVHVRADGITFDDGTPLTESAVCRRLDESFIRAMIHDSQRSPIDATNRRRYPTTRQKRVAMEAHNHECVDCQSTELLELDHNPPYGQTGHTVSTELEPRCAPCHRARHRRELGRYEPRSPQRNPPRFAF